MLSAKKLGHRQIEYYLSYASRGAEGFWVGRGAVALGLTGAVDPADFVALAQGMAPGGAKLLERVPKDRTPGWDFTFSAPKSVSLCYALGDDAVRQAISEAHRQATRAALEFLEDTGGRARRGLGGRDGHVAAGLAVACFTHPSSRELDPQLHVHGLVLNVARGDDGRWTALDSRTLYLHKRAAASIYRAELRASLSRLGARWEPPDRRGLAEMVGIDRAARRMFSTRRAQIEARLAPGSSSGAAQVACIATRQAKVHVELEALLGRWRTQAQSLGWDSGRVGELLDGTDRRQGLSDAARSRTEESLLAPNGLTQETAAFTRDDTIVAWGELLTQGASRQELEALATHTLARSEVVPLVVADEEGHALTTERRGARSGLVRLVRRPAGGNGTLVCEPRYSTVELLATEARLLETATASRGVGAGLVQGVVVDDVLRARPHLSNEQQQMVRRACCSGDLVEVVVGVPGSGKTFALEAAKTAWQASGRRVLGAALSAAAAAQLQAGSGITSETFDSLRLRVSGGRESLGPGSVIVIDEAGMLDTRRTAQLVDWARRFGSKVVLAGDDRQLPAVETGGAFAGLARRLDASRLHANSRQVAAWEREALRALRDGRSGEAAGSYFRHGRVHVFSSAHELLATMVSKWWEARTSGAQAALYSYSREAAWVLNTMARACLTEAGRLEGAELVVAECSALDLAERRYRVGEEICCLKNRGRLGARRDPSGLGVRNGTRGTVEALEQTAGELSFRTDDGRLVHLPAEYVRRHTDYGYAWTLHKGQGQTVGQVEASAPERSRVEGRAFVYGADTLSAEAALVAASRATDTTELFVLVDPQEDASEPRDMAAELGRAWARSQAETMATDELEILRQVAELASAPYAEEIAARRHSLIDAMGMGPLADPVAMESGTRRGLGRAAVALEELEAELAEARVALELATDGDERREMKQHLAGLLRDRRELEGDVTLAVSAAEGTDELLSRQARARAEHGSDLRVVGQQLEVVDSALATRRQRHIDGLCEDPPEHVLLLLGRPPPPEDARHLRWRQGVTEIEDYRRSVGLEQPGGRSSSEASAWTEALGEEPDGFEGRRYRRVVEDIRAVRRDIGVEEMPLSRAVSASAPESQKVRSVARSSPKNDRRRRRAPPRRGRGMER